MKKKIVVFTGAGISKESGIPTFRDMKDGLWENYNPDEVATLSAWKKNKIKVIEFFNERAREYSKCEPNDAHKLLANLEEKYDVTIITQNVDNLHEMGGSTNVLHLHGNLSQSKSSLNTKLVYALEGDIKIGDKCEKGSQLRHNVVLFEETLPENEFKQSIKAMEVADILIIVGTTLQVYPAADIIKYFEGEHIYVVDPGMVYLAPSPKTTFIVEPATRGVRWLYDKLTE